MELDGPEFRPEEIVGARLRDGTPVRVRPARAHDRSAVLAFVRGLSLDSFELRFFSAVHAELAVDEILAPPASGARLSLLMESLVDSEIIAQGEFDRSRATPTEAEVAFLVADGHQGQGAATLLLWELARRGRRAGIRRFTAIVLPENFVMRAVFLAAGFPCLLSYSEGETRVEMDIAREPQLALCVLARPGEANR